MTVSKLIEKLKEFPQDIQVVTDDDEGLHASEPLYYQDSDWGDSRGYILMEREDRTIYPI